MSSLNVFPGQHAGAGQSPGSGQQPGRPNARPAAQDAARQNSWTAPHGNGAPAGWPQQPAGYPQGGYAAQQVGHPQQASYGPEHQGYGAPADPYAPQFEPYTPVPQRAAQPVYQQPYPPPAQPASFGGQPQGYGATPASHWGAQQVDGSGYEPGSYMPQGVHDHYRPAAEHQRYEQEPSLSDWQQPQPSGHGSHPSMAGYAHDAYAGQPAGSDIGFAQAAGGELDTGYDDEDAEYDVEERPRGRRSFMIAAALAGAILVGGGMAYGYKSLLGGRPVGEPPVIKSASEPSRTKPADAGGKQFAHADSKIMGRLGEGSAAGATTPAAAAEVDESGTRKVPTFVVGRDGNIQAPEATAEATAPAAAGGGSGVPGMTLVDAFGNSNQKLPPAIAAVAASTVAESNAAAQQAAQQKVVVTPPPPEVKPVKVAATEAPKIISQATTGSIEQGAAPPKAAVKKVAKKVVTASVDDAFVPSSATTSPAAAVPASVATTGNGASGFVAVLASVPRSSSSRMDALKRFADMQQKYGSVLSGKTPDVADANLGAKGNYHRLVVGPPGSREQASAVCTQLKSQGYADCWVTSY